ncbi:unnamed protein product [Adineta steineri]|uniref:WAP domain-containing protein n=1 Tax=Adineta steineri TaxID=433720 RepID=A0A818VBD8_9BILA|nr:unnamed protein product [Adineta steineri]CAF3710270.1 unnamed protein product [Adineta steineri]
MVAIGNAKLICPGYGFIRPLEPCVDQCSLDKDTCGAGKLCCYTPQSPCGNRCLIGKDDAGKKGTCPSSQSEQKDPKWGLCDGHFCDVDNDCSCKKKCCSNKCGSKICISPQ